MQFELILYPKMTNTVASAAVGSVMLQIFFMACNLYNSFVRTPNLVFLDSMERSLSLEFGHIPVNGIWCPHIFLKFDCSTKCANCLVVMICMV